MASVTRLSIAADRLLYLDVSAGHVFQVLDNALGLPINWDLSETYASRPHCHDLTDNFCDSVL